jgi:hypothetical protein
MARIHWNALCAHRSHQMHKCKFGITCPSVLFMETAPSPPEHEKLYVDVSRLGCTGMHYMTSRSHWVQKHNYSVMCPHILFWKPHRAHPSMKNSATMFSAPDAIECTT